MIITYQGLEFFKVQLGDLTIAYNPISKESDLKGARFGADIVLVSLNHKDMNGAQGMAFGDRTPFVISGPGEYEIKGIFVKGVPGESLYGGVKRINTIYTLSLDNITLSFLGALSTPTLTSEAEEMLGETDILFAPIGGDGVLTGAEAAKLSVALEPKIIIPMHYGERGAKDALKTFLKETGEEKIQEQDKLTIKKKDLEGKEGEVVVLKLQN